MTTAQREPLRVEEVFITSGDPGETYVTRDDRIEGDIVSRLRARQKIVAVSGPSKSGKTVMIRRVITRILGWQMIEISGNEIGSIDDFWSTVGAQIGVVGGVEFASEVGSTFGGSTEVGVNILPVAARAVVSGELSETASTRSTAIVDLPRAVRERLRTMNACLVIDDFHYASDDVRTRLARALKEVIAQRIPVVMIAVPHRVLDLVEAERELNWRVVRKRVDHWSEVELGRIAIQGFTALNLHDAEGLLATDLAKNSVGSPLLMQELCKALCQANEVEERADEAALLTAPGSWSRFYTDIAADNVQHPLARALQAGPTQRRPRDDRALKEWDVKVDYYGAVLLALNRISPVTEVKEVDLQRAANALLVERMPLDRVRWVCKKMHDLAMQQRGEDDPAVEYVETAPKRLVIADPYLTFFLRWGLASLGLPVVVPM